MADTMISTSAPEVHEAALCPLAHLARDAERLLEIADRAEALAATERREGRDGTDADRRAREAWGHIHYAQTLASYLVPTSPEGALFLVAALAAEVDDLVGSHHDASATEAIARKIDRGFYGLRRFLEARFGLIGPREYIEAAMATSRDPHMGGGPRHV